MLGNLLNLEWKVLMKLYWELWLSKFNGGDWWEKKFKMLLLIVGALTLFSACSSVYSDEEMTAREMMIVLSKNY